MSSRFPLEGAVVGGIVGDFVLPAALDDVGQVGARYALGLGVVALPAERFPGSGLTRSM